MSDSSKANDWSILKRLMEQARPYWGHILTIFALDLLAVPLALLAPLPLKIAVDNIVGSQPFPATLQTMLPIDISASTGALLAFTCALVVIIALLKHLQWLGSWLLQTYTGEKLVLEFRGRLLRHAQRLSLAYHDSKGASDSVYRIQYDAPAIQWIAIHGITPLITAIFTFVGMLIITAWIDWQLALVAIIISPILLVLARIYQRRLRGQWREVKKLESSALSVVQEVLSALRVVKAFGQEAHEQARFVRHSSAGMLAHIRVAIAEGSLNLMVGVTISVGTAAVLFIGVGHVRAGILTVGELLVVMAYLVQLYEPLKAIGGQIAALQGSMASAERAFVLLDQMPDVVERPNTRPLERALGDVEFHNVSFAYDGNNPVLRDISFKIPAGTRVGVVGRTGAGKSTLISLLARFYDPSAGVILLDGTNLCDYKLADLRNQFAIVLQDPVLFSTNIHENIAYARPGASREEIEAAAQAADAHEFIVALPDGYDTPVGERGLRLSGGERQRISLARAFLKNAPILILDEPTSSVDTQTEASIMEAMDRLMHGRTTFMIAHRLSTLENCDYLLAIEGGQLVTATSDVTAAVRKRTLSGILTAAEGGMIKPAKPERP